MAYSPSQMLPAIVSSFGLSDVPVATMLVVLNDTEQGHCYLSPQIFGLQQVSRQFPGGVESASAEDTPVTPN